MTKDYWLKLHEELMEEKIRLGLVTPKHKKYLGG